MSWYWIALLAALPSLAAGAFLGGWWERAHPLAKVQADIAAIKNTLAQQRGPKVGS